eukprot:TRINITY_DN27013_c0_g1_i1.p1 TRINITY_DN27013_c0_g1~~TRINITY_DN27013_c0_g1_i1.p1  ORF type:complete len:343 (-),score=75.77 TRINITY_DN27013_c0_g1_i1:91-1119(-)
MQLHQLLLLWSQVSLLPVRCGAFTQVRPVRSCVCQHSAAASGQPAPAENAVEALHELLQLFQGDFDNYEQVVEDRAAGREPGPGGGHEHIHCRLQLVTDDAPVQLMQSSSTETAEPRAVVAARYYFNGRPEIVFRYRLYSFRPCQPAPPQRGCIEMTLWRLAPAVERELRQADYQLRRFDWERAAGDAYPVVAECMEGCEIYWSRGGGGGAAAAVDASASGAAVPAFLGLMGVDDDGTWIRSQNVDGLEILIKDDLKLFADELWVNDRGFARDGSFVYGNQRDVPYKMRRVTRGGALEWTLGSAHRTEQEYAERMLKIGVVPGAPAQGRPPLQSQSHQRGPP